MGTRLAVLGSPIAHSKSPLLHGAAYAALGLDWRYEAIEVTEDTLAEFVRSRDASWRGLSLTMPLKKDVLPLLDGRDPLVDVTGAANTVLFADGLLRGFNTDVYGVTQAFRDAGVTSLENVQVLGGGATAASVLAAVVELGATRITVSVRSVEKAAALTELGERLGVEVVVRPLGMQDRSLIVPDAVVSTLPGHADHGVVFAEAIRHGSVLFDVAYDPWPSTFATAWLGAGGPVISGLEMLINQALAQVRIFVSGSASVPLENESAVLAAMRAAVTP